MVGERGALVVLAAILLMLWSTPGHTSALNAAQVMGEIQQKYGQVDTLRANFRQEVRQAAFGQTFVANGRILYSQGKIRWDYQAPDPQTYVVADQAVYWVQPSERQIIKMKLDQAFSTHLAVAALLGGMSELNLYFDPISATVNDGHWRLRLRPKFENAQVADVTVVYDPKRQVVAVVEILDAFGNGNHIELSDVQKGAVVPPQTFVVEGLAGYKLTVFGD